MANHTGVEGTVKVGTNTIAEIKSFTFSEAADTIEDSTINDTFRTYQAGLKSWQGSVECFWDETDTNGQIALASGGTVTLNLYPEGATTGDIYYSGSVIINSVNTSVPTNGMVDCSFGFQGSGTFTRGTAA